MAQDSMGFIWFGTMGGLCRYDGYGFKTFIQIQRVPSSLPSNNIKCIEVLPDNTILIGTSNGLAVYNPVHGRVNCIKELIGSEINKIKRTRNGAIWLSTSKGMVLCSLAGGQLRMSNRSLPTALNTEAVSLDEDGNGSLWIACLNGTIKKISTSNYEIEQIPDGLRKEIAKLHSLINVIRCDRSGNVWFGSLTNGLLEFDIKKQKCIFLNSRSPLPKMNRIRDILFEGDNVWVAARNGLFKFADRGNQVYRYISERNKPFSLSNSSICSLLKDKSGVLWVGTYLGGSNLSVPNDNAITYLDDLQPGNGLNNKIIYSFIYDSIQKGLWLGTGGGGVNFLNLQRGDLQYYKVSNNNRKSIDYDYIESLSLLPNRQLLVGTLLGLFHLDANKKSYLPIQINAHDKPKCAIFSMINDGDGTWIGTQKGLFYRHYNGTVDHWNTKSKSIGELETGEITALCKDKENGVWVGRVNGLSYKQSNTNYFINYDDVSILQEQYINAICMDHVGNIWIGTNENGLVVYNPATKTFVSINQLLGIQLNSIKSILEDGDDSLWLTTVNAIYKMTFLDSGHRIGKTLLRLEKILSGDGTQSNEFSRAVTKLGDSAIVFGGYNGGVIIRPNLFQKNSFIAPIVITDFQVNNVSNVNESLLNKRTPLYIDTIILPYNYAYFSFEFAALNFINPNNNQYAYKMEGLKNDDWHYVGNDRRATYTNLSPGNYTFMVKGANNDGVWNPVAHKVVVTILPPIWQTWYAYLFYIITGTGITIYLLRLYKRTTQLKHELHLQHLRNEMDNEFAEKKMNFYTNISHEIKTPLSLILGPLGKITQSIGNYNDANEKVISYLSIMRRNGEKLMGLVKQLLDYRRIEAGKMELACVQDNFSSFVSTIVDNFRFLAKEKNVHLRFVTEMHYLPYDFDPDKMEHILNNLLSNAIKFTPSGGGVQVSLSMQKKLNDQNKIVLTIEDNGIGIPKSHIPHLFEPFHQYDKQSSNGSGIGLTYTKALVELHGGSIEVESELSSQPFQGYTKFMLLFPVQYETPNMNLDIGIGPIEHSDNQSILISQYEIPFMKSNTTVSDMQDGSLEKIILIVEDNADMLFFLNDHFSALYKVVTAMNGENGWEIVQNIIPDLIISDLMMPGMSGIEFCRLVKENDSTMHIPFILLTAKDTDESKIIGFKTGADDYVCKPFNIDLLEVRVENLFTKQMRLQEHHRKIAENYILNTDKHIPTEKEEFIQKIVDFVHENILEPELNVERLSLSLNMSRITLYRKMKALTGLTTIEFIRNIRLQKAAQLLLEGRYNVNEVCYAVGFSDTDYFRKSFKSFFGILPSDYAATKH